MGASVGETVATVGCWVGNQVAIGVLGKAVGTMVGERVGSDERVLGCCVGNQVVAVGERVDSAEGAGVELGLAVGACVGSGVRGTEGMPVGASEGN